MRAFLEHGAGAKAARAHGSTPLPCAAIRNEPEVVSLLCLKGALLRIRLTATIGQRFSWRPFVERLLQHEPSWLKERTQLSEVRVVCRPSLWL